MRLELRRFEVEDLVPGPATRYAARRLTVDVQALEALLAADPRLGSMRIHLLRPGESTRIVHVLDVMQPRTKGDRYEGYFPGLLAESALAGQGVTYVLDNVGVVLTGDLESAEEGVIDLSGPGSELSAFGKMFHLVLVPSPASPDLDVATYGQAIIEAGAKASIYLASAARGLEPDRVEVFDWEAEARTPDLARLPRLAYIAYSYAHGFGREKLWYGRSTKYLVPSIAHPNEILDGALVDNGFTRPLRNTTYDIVNNAVLRELYARHRRELLFTGLVLTPHSLNYTYKRAFAERAAQLCHTMLGADAVIITKDGGGQADVDLFQAVTFCEELWMKTVAAIMEMCGVDGANPPVADASVYGTALVSLGNGTEPVRLPPMARAIGGDRLVSVAGAPAGQIDIASSRVVGVIDEMGGSRTYSRAI